MWTLRQNPLCTFVESLIQAIRELERTEQIRANVLLGSSVVMALLLSITVPIRHYFSPLPAPVIIVSVLNVVGFMLLPYLFMRSKNVPLCAGCALLGLFSIVAIGSLMIDGLNTSVISLIVLFPAAAMFLSGFRGGLLFTLLSLGFLLTLLYGHSLQAFPGVTYLTDMSMYHAKVIVLSALLLFSLCLGWCYEASWKTSTSLLRSVSETSPDGLFVLRKKGLIESVSPSTLSIFGMSKREWCGRSLSDFFVGGRDCQRLRDILLLPYAELVRYTEGQRFELIMKSETGAVPVELVIGTCIEAKQRRAVVFARDISERQQIDKLKNELIANVSHELRTPLTSIHGGLRLLESEVLVKLPQQAKTIVELASRNSTRLLTLVNNLLDVEKLSSGEMNFDVKDVELVGLVDECIASMERTAVKKSIELVHQKTEDKLWTKADKERVGQVLGNLLSNAIKFSPEHSSVKIHLERDGDDEVVCVVEDQGIGISEGQEALLFRRFSQAEAPDTKQHSGTGLGLAVCKGLIEGMDGSIGLMPDTPSGARFFFRLPLSELSNQAS